MMDLKERIEQELSEVIDPETGLSVVRMGLIRDMKVDSGKGAVSLIFRPTSYFCPMAFKLAVDIRNAVVSVPGVRTVAIRAEDFARANELNEILAEE